MSNKKILFISHTAARTGAPINLLRFLRWFKENSEMSFQILLQSGGELLPDFEALAPVTILYRDFFGKTGSVYHNFASRLSLKILKEKLTRERFDLIYSNTAINGHVLEFLSNLSCPVISHIHELEYYIQHHIGRENFALVKKYSQRYIAISHVVRHNLIKNHHILPENIELVYDFLPHMRSSGHASEQQACAVRKHLHIPEHAFLVCASGTIDWRKGPDLFIQLASQVHKCRPELPIYFIWVGGETQEIDFERLQHDIIRLELVPYIKFLGTQPNPLDYFSACDVFALVSREEPFGLVCLEAAALGKPSLCFEGSGIQEFIEDDCGYVVPYLDIHTMAIKIIDLFTKTEQRLCFGEQARKKAQERHDVKRIAPKINDIITKCLENEKI